MTPTNENYGTGSAQSPETSSPTSTTSDDASREADSSQSGGGPAGTGERVVKDGECVASIAKDTGHFWETLWNDPGNSALKEARKDQNILLPGDRIHIPKIKPKTEPGETEMRHRFRRKGEPQSLALKLLDGAGQPRVNEPYTLEIDGQEFTGTTDAEGRLEHAIPGNARRGHLVVGEDDYQDEYELSLGELDPITEIGGVQGRLNNLGFNCGRVDGVLGEKTRVALTAFQHKHELEETGKPDDRTRAKLVEVHGS